MTTTPDEMIAHRRVLTFDVYGTLIDWETGLREALQKVFSAHQINQEGDEALRTFARHEASVGAGDYRPYRDMLAETLKRMGAEMGFHPTHEQLQGFVDSVRDWPAFDDSAEGLRRLKSKYQLAVITNCDDEHFAMSNKHLGGDFDFIVTAEMVRSYKPSLNNFHYAMGLIKVPREEILHVADSLYHDIEPAKRLGLTTARIDRRHNKPGFGASPNAAVFPDMSFRDMTSFADALLNEPSAS